MVEIYRLPDVDEAERQASEWIARLHADDVSAADRADFEAWRTAHPRHARAYGELLETWGRFTDAGRLVRAVAVGQELGASARQAVRAATSDRSAPRSRRHFFAAAVAAAVVASVGWIYVTERPQTLFETAIGERATIGLPDGSSLELNSNSRARVAYTEEARIVRLERGEAFFQVEHDARRPFWVIAGGSWVRAVGTAFNVYVRDAGVRVTVSEGTVKVAAVVPSSTAMPTDLQLERVAVSFLSAGQQVEVRGAAAEVRSLAPVDLSRSASWRNGTIYFDSQPLGAVVQELSRYSTLRVVIDDNALRDLQVGGTFQANAQGTEALLTTLRDGFGLHVRREGTTAYVEETP